MKQFAFLKIELKALLREPVSVFFMVVIPLILTIVFGGAFGDEPTQYGKNVLGIDTVVPVNIVFLLANAGLMGISITILELKEQGVLKRYHTYPVNLKTYFTSLVLTFSLVSILSTLLFLLIYFRLWCLFLYELVRSRFFSIYLCINYLYFLCAWLFHCFVY